ncbi:hypothetical protein CPB86DRAFT_712571 [Serendipita vermifera]|nr:hypothetical protein CPB86DRAFT_712571 [Serendipita vermifera]
MLLPESHIPEVEPVINSLSSLVAPNCPIALDSDEGQAYANSLFAKLKALNRQAHGTVRQYKQQTTESRASMEESLLKLQNLLYEKRHLEREIEKCKEYASIYQDVPLQSEQEFRELAPLEMQTPQVLSNEHQYLVARLEWELAERKRLEEMRIQLVKERDELLVQSQQRQAKEEDWDKRTETLAKVRPIPFCLNLAF